MIKKKKDVEMKNIELVRIEKMREMDVMVMKKGDVEKSVIDIKEGIRK